jgi:4-amino-4-deoxy-L-arabinose transferase-like glycosyltransferase
VALLAALAASLRFYTLGDWSFAGDEIATLQETRALFGPGEPAGESQIDRLPRVIPASYIINRAGYALFGWDEWGTRVVSALSGTALVGVVAVLGPLVLGRRVAMLLAVLIAVSPAYIFQSQTNRFYSLAALFAGTTILAGAVSLKRASVWWATLALVSLAVSMLTHAVTAALAPALGVGMFLTRQRDVPALPRTAVVVGGVATVAIAAWLAIYVRPLLAGWNEGVSWAYSPVHSTMAAVNMLGWPLSLLAGVGVVLMVEDRSELRWYWLCCLATWVTTSIALPFVMTYQPWYSFPTALAVLVFAAYGAGGIYDRLRPSRPFTSAAFVALVVSLGLPGLVSHYLDGSKADARAAIEYVDRHWAPGDRIATRMRTFSYYAPERTPVIPIASNDAAAKTLEQLASAGGRLWVVIESGRGGPAAAVQRWLSANASHRLRVMRSRLDYYEYAVDVFLVTPGGTRN